MIQNRSLPTVDFFKKWDFAACEYHFGYGLDYEDAWGIEFNERIRSFKGGYRIKLEGKRAVYFPDSEGYEESNDVPLKTIRECLRQIAPYYTRDAVAVYYDLGLSLIKEIKISPKRTRFIRVAAQPELFEFFTPDLWMRIYPGLKRDRSMSQGEGAAGLIAHAIDQLWNLICVNEGRAVIARTVFGDMARLLAKFGEEFYGEALLAGVNARTREERLMQYYKPLLESPLGLSVFHYYFPARWKSLKTLGAKEFMLNRLADYKDLFNKNICSMKPKGCLEELIRRAYASLNRKLIRDNYFIECKNPRCRKLATAFRGKKYCSRDIDGQDCRQRVYQNKHYKARRPVEKMLAK